MTIYTVLSHLVIVVTIIAVIVGYICARTLVRAYSGEGLNVQFDATMDEWEFWAESERERKAEVYAFGKDRQNSPLGYYGPKVLVERWLFTRKYNFVWSLVNYRDNGTSGYVHMKTRNLAERLVANNLRRYMNLRSGNGFHSKPFSWVTAATLSGTHPRLVRTFDRVQEFIFS